MSERLSLKGRALQLLAQREQSCAELRRKLTAHAAAGESRDSDEGEAAPVAARVEEVLDWLIANHFASDERFAESRIHARAERFGNLRIRSELAQHDVAVGAELAQRLKDGELERALRVWQRKFGEAPDGAAAQARQARFLAGRGFSPEVIRQVMRHVMQHAVRAAVP